ncbi:hypothetical protein [Dysgonomonas termitidis]|uniref:DUF3868 domain-containing protein n=1 Tax=Dysgonomonas termitidis TaxID=1516126 RepID=A0ABV9KSI9_9BACT
MKKIFIIFLMMTFVCFLQRTYAQQYNSAKYKDIEFEYDNENVYVRVYLNLQDYYVELGDSLTLTPLISANANALELPYLVLIGQGKQGFHLFNRSLANATSYRFLRISNQNNELYQATVPYESWMNNSRLDMKIDLSQIGGLPLYSYAEALRNNINPKGARKENPIVSANSEFRVNSPSRTENSFSVPADFSRESATFDLRLSGKKSFVVANQEEVNKIRALIDWAMTNENISLIGVYITSYTSVDGIYMDNDELTKGQSLAFKRTLQAGNNYPDALFFTEWKGEDWPGLTELVKQSNMPYQQEVLNIINNTGIFTGRELKLMQLAQGNPYRYMRDNLFPQQWRIECRVVYKRN